MIYTCQLGLREATQRRYKLTLPTSWRETPSGLIWKVSYLASHTSKYCDAERTMTKLLSLALPFSPAKLLPSSNNGAPIPSAQRQSQR